MRRRATPRGGFTLLEVSVATAILAVVGYTLAGAIEMGSSSQRLVTASSSANSATRASSAILVEELGLCQSASLTLTELPDGNDEIELRLPITVDGDPEWGVSDPLLGTHAGWRLRYTVVVGADGNKQLVRQIVGDLNQVRTSDVIVPRLIPEQGMGFDVTPAGDVLQVTISTLGHAGAVHGEEMRFDVLTRN